MGAYNRKRNEKIKKCFGIHLIAEFWGGKIIEDSKEFEDILIEATRSAKNIPLKTAIHKFSPYGITGIVLLAESHIALHLWSEFNYLAIDIFTCGNKARPFKALQYLRKKFEPKKVHICEIKRGDYIGEWNGNNERKEIVDMRLMDNEKIDHIMDSMEGDRIIEKGGGI